MNTKIHGGFDGIPNLREAKRLWQLAGGTLSHPRRTGEVLFSHPAVGSVRVNNRRKDSSRELVTRLRRLQELCGCQGAA
ncbi:MAG: hypothetical protein U1E73_09795 [Planctomycetota bacterium]